MSRLTRVLIVVVVAASGAAVHPASHANDIVKYTSVFNTDVAYAGRGGMRGNGIGSLELTGVSGTINRALLYWQGPTNSSDPASNAAVKFAGHDVTGTNIGSSHDNCWGFSNSQSYRADVTEHVTGNGTFDLANFKKGAADVSGASLIVFFQDGNRANDRDIVLFEGNDSNVANASDAQGWDVLLSGITYTTGVVSLDLHVADGQVWYDDGLSLNGTEFVAGPEVFEGNTMPGGAGPSGNGNLWDIRSFDVTSFMEPGNNDINLTTGYVDDCLSLVVAAINLPAGAAPDRPTCSRGGLLAEPTVLNSDGNENGPVSGAVHEVDEPLPDPVNRVLHEANCDAVLTVEGALGLSR